MEIFKRGRKTHRESEETQIPNESLWWQGSFSIPSSVYEQKLDSEYGIVLQALNNGEEIEFNGDLENNVSFNGGYKHSPKKIKDRILKRYESLPGFCSMKLEELEELFEHIKKIHEVSYNHYAWAKKINLEGKFPRYCCGSSARNVFLTLMDKGYPNSALVYNAEYDHSYVVLSFIIKEDKKKGFIIIDPTSDQLFNDQKIAPRNNLFVVFNNRWEYKTDWKRGANLYPSPEDFSTFSNLHILRNQTSSKIPEKEGIEEYFEEVFKNPVKVKISSL